MRSAASFACLSCPTGTMKGEEESAHVPRSFADAALVALFRAKRESGLD